MLTEFRVENFRSIREEQMLSLVAGRGTRLAGNLVEEQTAGAPPGRRFLKTVALYGPNASGKSNLIKALAVMRQFVLTSATKMNQGDRIEGVVPFRLSTETREKPSRFEVEFILEGVNYEYGFSADATRVHSEWLHAYPKGRKQAWLERERASDDDKGVFEARWLKDSECELLRKSTRENGLALSQAAQLNLPTFSQAFTWMRSGLVIEVAEGAVRDVAVARAQLLKESPSSCSA